MHASVINQSLSYLRSEDLMHLCCGVAILDLHI
uniref:Uncharacterized protein n=1 Tax=Podoviridae sp. ctuQh21 TaxID=2825284 RepID=A0A8S5PEY7_9CAUD|nr:MAG TPA: hypothetical protein [Podoviridae sp. ctuQh21]DAT13966.1 MAG TPA: hypothetical protein [Caudoviricetes sp.]DAT30085.1 MAG TPA: hypothetical protein [Caudoviricetes sp.]